MATVVYKNAKVLVNGVEISTSLNEFGVDIATEMLDETAMGDDTRINKGGLYTMTMTAAGFCEFGALGIHDLVYGNVGVDGTMVVAYPDGITEGTATLKGYAMLGVIESLEIGGSVGTLLPITFTVQSRGVVP